MVQAEELPREYLKRNRPAFLLDKIYPHLREQHEQVALMLEPILAQYASSVRQGNNGRYNIDLVRSGFHRYLSQDIVPSSQLSREEVESLQKGAQDIERVRSNFARIDSPNNPVWSALGTGSNDADFYLGLSNKIVRADGNDKLTDEDIFYLQDKFNRIVLHSFNQYTRTKKFGEASSMDVTEDGFKRTHYIFSNNEYSIDAVFGVIPTAKKLVAGRICVKHFGKEVFVVDLGFATNWANNKRFGPYVSDKSQLGAAIKDKGETLVIDDRQDSERELHKKRKILIGQDAFASFDVDKVNLSGDLERVIRALRVNAFYHKSFSTKWSEAMVQMSQMFQDPAWLRTQNVIKEAIMAFERNKSEPTPEMQKVFIKEILVMIEHDPYLFLLLSEKTGLLRIFPQFRYESPGFERKLLTTADAFNFCQREGKQVPFYERNFTSIWASRQIWLQGNDQGIRYSGLKMLLNALHGYTIDVQDPYLTNDDAEELYHYEKDRELPERTFGYFSFNEENRLTKLDLARNSLETNIAFIQEKMDMSFTDVERYIRRYLHIEEDGDLTEYYKWRDQIKEVDGEFQITEAATSDFMQHYKLSQIDYEHIQYEFLLQEKIRKTSALIAQYLRGCYPSNTRVTIDTFKFAPSLVSLSKIFHLSQDNDTDYRVTSYLYHNGIIQSYNGNRDSDLVVLTHSDVMRNMWQEDPHSDKYFDVYAGKMARRIRDGLMRQYEQRQDFRNAADRFWMADRDPKRAITEKAIWIAKYYMDLMKMAHHSRYALFINRGLPIDLWISQLSNLKDTAENIGQDMWNLIAKKELYPDED